ncbi:hypothetical protein AB837_00417 [bacterium AB1]|nr:hypothetical protein AB837_00417 [bacterium AB1]
MPGQQEQSSMTYQEKVNKYLSNLPVSSMPVEENEQEETKTDEETKDLTKTSLQKVSELPDECDVNLSVKDLVVQCAKLHVDPQHKEKNIYFVLPRLYDETLPYTYNRLTLVLNTNFSKEVIISQAKLTTPKKQFYLFFSNKTNRMYQLPKTKKCAQEIIAQYDLFLSNVERGNDFVLNAQITCNSTKFHQTYINCIDSSIPPLNLDRYNQIADTQYQELDVSEHLYKCVLDELKNPFFDTNLYGLNNSPNMYFYKRRPDDLLELSKQQLTSYNEIFLFDYNFKIIYKNGKPILKVESVNQALSDCYTIPTYKEVSNAEKEGNMKNIFYILDQDLDFGYTVDANMIELIKESFPDICFDDKYSQEDFEFHSRLLVYAQDRSLHPNCKENQSFVIRHRENGKLHQFHERIKSINFFLREDVTKYFASNVSTYCQSSSSLYLKDKNTGQIYAPQNSYLKFLDLIYQILQIIIKQQPKDKIVIVNLGLDMTKTPIQLLVLNILLSFCFSNYTESAINVLSTYPLLESKRGANFTFVPIGCPPINGAQITHHGLQISFQKIEEKVFYEYCKKFFQQTSSVTRLKSRVNSIIQKYKQIK